MKKNKVFVIILLLLVVCAGWLYYSKRNGTISEALRDFGVKDTGSIVKIFMADKAGQQVTLEKTDDQDWILNGKFPARPDAIKTLLETMHDVVVRSPVGKNGYNNVIKNIAAKGIKVEIYNKEGLLKTYYVGGPTQDQMGTFMYLENSTVPFITNIPGFDGYLTSRYIVRAEDWKIKNVFRLKPNQLKKLSVTDRERPGYIFTLTNDGNGVYKMTDEKGLEVNNLNQDKVISYLQFFGMINYEMTERTLKSSQKDSMTNTIPFRTIELTNLSNQTSKVDLWRRPQTENTVNKANSDGTPYPYDIDRMTARINNDTTLVVVQYYTFEKLFRTPADFINQSSEK